MRVTHPAELQNALEAALCKVIDDHPVIQNLARIAGGASKEMWRLELIVNTKPWQGRHQLILARPLGGKIYREGLDLVREFKVMQAAYNAGVRVPRPFWLLPDLLGAPAMLVECRAGESIGRRVVQDPRLAEARSRLPAQMGAALGAIHRIDVDAHGLRAIVPGPASNQTPAQALISHMEADLDRIGEPHPALELCLRWLRRHEPPAPDHLVLVHGDFRIGNVLVTEEGLNGVLDWEFAHLGDPAEDVSWGMVRDWRFGMDHLRYGGVGTPESLLAAYQQHSGYAIDARRLFYWEVVGNVRWAIGTLNQAQRHLSGEAPNLEFASLGRRCAEMELEALTLIREADQRMH